MGLLRASGLYGLACGFALGPWEVCACVCVFRVSVKGFRVVGRIWVWVEAV